MTSYTKTQRFPYPTSGRENGNGALHLQQLAEAVDARLDDLDVQWPAELQKPGVYQTLTSGPTALTLNDFSLITFNNDVARRGGWPAGNLWIVGSDALAGWYQYECTITTRVSGALTGSRRTLNVRVAQTTPSAAGSLVRENYWLEELDQASQDVYLHTSFVTYLDGKTSIQAYVFHNNAGSTVNVTNTLTEQSCFRIAPRT